MNDKVDSIRHYKHKYVGGSEVELRDQFAMAILPYQVAKFHADYEDSESHALCFDSYADEAYVYADAMLRARER